MTQKKYPQLSEKLKNLRKAHSYRQVDVAAALGVIRQTYANYEQGIRTPDHETLYKLAGLYNISVDDLMSLIVDLDPDEYFDAPKPTKTSTELNEFIDYCNDPTNIKRLKHLSNLEKELLFFYEQLSVQDRKELVEIAKIKTYKYID